MAISCSNTV